MESKFCVRRSGFSLIELLIVIAVIGVMAATMTINPNAAKVSSKREAERLAMFLKRMAQKSERMHVGFVMTITNDNKQIIIWWRNNTSDDITASRGCTYSNNNFWEIDKNFDDFIGIKAKDKVLVYDHDSAYWKDVQYTDRSDISVGTSTGSGKYIKIDDGSEYSYYVRIVKNNNDFTK